MVNFQLSSSAIERGAYIPKKYTGDGENVSPPLQWTAPPEGTKSLALICDDPDAPSGTWVHWVVWGIKPDARELAENVPPLKEQKNGIKQGTTDFRKIGYGGPTPPPGSDHRYYFRLYALDIDLAIRPGASKKELLGAAKGHVLAEAQLVGRYRR